MERLESRALLAAIATVVEDQIPGGGINNDNASSSPSQIIDVTGTTYFSANDGINGTELWRINSSGVAELVDDAVAGGGINPGISSSDPGSLTNVNGTLYFTANDGVNGLELWRINSSGVAELVEDSVAGGGINPGGSGSYPSYLTNVNGTVYFRAADANGTELWRINSSGVAQMVEDAVAGGGINPGSSNSNPSSLTNVNGTLYFRAVDAAGTELWRISSSGVAEMVEDALTGGGISPGSGGSSPTSLTNVNGTLYFTAGDGVNGTELWRINSSGVAEMVEDAVAGGGIRPGISSSGPNSLTNVNGTLYFSASDGVNGTELWRINSSGLAQIVEDALAGGGISPGSGSSVPIALTNVNGTLYFIANDGVNGTELWRINSSGVAEMVEDAVAGGGINAGGSSYLGSLTNVNGTLYFRARDAANGDELWRINSSGVAEMVEDVVAGGGINAGSGNSNPRYLTNLSGTLYFRAFEVATGYELWRINSLGVAEMVEDAVAGGGISPGSGSSNPRYLTNINGTLYFRARGAANDEELWRINSSGVAEMVEDAVAGGGISPGSGSSSPSSLTNVNGTLYFTAFEFANGTELWRINSSGVAEMVEDAVAGGGINAGSGSSNPRYLTNVSGTLYFTAFDGVNGTELWRINSSGVAEMVEDAVAEGGISPGNGSSGPIALTNVNGTLYFTASEFANGTELWRISSSGVAEMVEDAVAGGGIDPGPGSSNPRYLTNVNGTLYFRAFEVATGYELWRISSSGVAEMVEDAVAGGGISPESGSSNPRFLTNVNGTLYFSASDAANGTELWRISSSGVAEMVEDAVAGGGINPGGSSSSPGSLTNGNGTLYFRARDAANGYELWRINSSGVAEMVEDAVAGGGINPGSSGSYPGYLTNVNGTLYLRARDAANGDELWRINSSGVAEMVEDAVAGGGINPGSISSNPRYLTNVNGTLYFRAFEVATGYELWRINSLGVAEMVEDAVAGGGINPGSSSSNLTLLTNANGTLYFRAFDAANGTELWRINSSGVAEMVEDALAGGGINPGAGGSNPSQMTAIGNNLYFVADDGLANGIELWVLSLNTAPTDIGLSSQTLTENSGVNAIVGTLSFTDPDAGDTATFSLPAGIASNNLFNIAPDGATLRTNGDFNFEVLSSYSITVRVIDAGGLAFDKQFIISVTDVNEAPTAVSLQNVVSSLPESTSTSSHIKVADILVTDDALGTNGLTVTGPDAAFFEISGSELFLKSGTTLDFEGKPTFSITVQVDDPTVGSTPDLIVPYSLTLSDVNESPTAVSLQNVVSTLPEGTSTSLPIKVANILVTDDALGTNGLEVTGPDAAFFEISGAQLFLKSGTPLNFEGKPTFSITVQVDDPTVGNTPDLTVPYSLSLSDVNESPTAVSLQNVVSTLPENTNTALALKVADVVIADDALGTNSLSIVGFDSAYFQLVGTELFLKSGTILDFEGQQAYSFTVQVDDSSVGTTPDASTTYALSVTAVNEAPTDVALSTSAIDENKPFGSTVGTFSTSDPDNVNTFTYSLVSGIGGTDNARFTISGNALNTATRLDFEARSSYSIRVRSQDQAGLYVEKIFTITVNNLTEVSGLDVQFGQRQRSYIRNVDILFDQSNGLPNLLSGGRVQVTKRDLMGNNPTLVNATTMSVLGQSIRLDFGANGLGGNRNAITGDGYYEVGVDVDGDGTFESSLNFFRLLGDVSGDGVVDNADLMQLASASGYSPENDVNGDGFVNSNDRTLVQRSLNRRLVLRR